MLTRSIDLYSNGLTLEKFLGGAKRACIISAIAALTLSALDLANIRSVEAAVQFLHDNRQLIAELPDRIRSEIDRMSIVSESASVTIAIPRDEVATISQPAPFELASIPVKADVSPLVAELAAARHLDAVEVAMAAPPSWAKPELHVAPESAPVAAAASLPIILASADEGSVPETAMSPTLASLPMSSAIPLDMVPMPRPAPGVPPPSPAQRLHLRCARSAPRRSAVSPMRFISRRAANRCAARWRSRRSWSTARSPAFIRTISAAWSIRTPAGISPASSPSPATASAKLINERGAWARANRIAKQTLDGQIYVPEVAKSTHYHAVYVHPNWVREMKKMVRFGIHNFYRPIAWGNGAEEPVWGTAALAANKKN